MSEQSLYDYIFLNDDETISYFGEKLDKGWYFWDECGLIGDGPYETQELAKESLEKYIEELNWKHM